MSFINVEGDTVNPPKIDEEYTLTDVYVDDDEKLSGFFVLKLLSRGPKTKYVEIHISPFSPLLEHFAIALLASKRKHETNRQDFIQGGK